MPEIKPQFHEPLELTPCLSLREVSARLGISRTRVYQIEQRALGKLRVSLGRRLGLDATDE